MIDKDTQLDANENIPEVIFNFFKRQKRRKISIPIIPTAFCFKLESQTNVEVKHQKLPSRCGSRKDIRLCIRRNNSECNIRTNTTKTNSLINISFSSNAPQASKKLIKGASRLQFV
jgi:hypothetical protein